MPDSRWCSGVWSHNLLTKKIISSLTNRGDTIFAIFRILCSSKTGRFLGISLPSYLIQIYTIFRILFLLPRNLGGFTSKCLLSKKSVVFMLLSQTPNRDQKGIVKLSEFEQNLGKTQIHNPLIVKHSGCRPKVENQPNLT